MGEGHAPELDANLTLRRDRTGRKTPLDSEELCIGRGLLQPERRFPLTHLNLRFTKLMPVDKNVCGGKPGARRIRGRRGFNGFDVSGLFVDCCGDRAQGCDRLVALLEIAFDFEIKVFPVITCQSDSCPTQAETVLDRGQTKTTLECGNIAILELRLNISAECQLKLWTAGNDVNRGFLF